MSTRQDYRQYRGRRPKNKYVAAMLAFIFGMFGVHKFYLEKPSQGVFYIFLFFMMANIFNAPLTAFLGFIDALMLMFMSQEEFDARYNKGAASSGQRSSRRVPKQRSVSSAPTRTSRRTKKKNPFKLSGAKKYEDYDVDGAIKDFEQAIDIAPDDPELHYMMGKAYSLDEQKDKSFYHLTQAARMGHPSIENVKTEDDFAYIRIQPEYEEFLNNNYSLAPSSMRLPKEDVKDDVLLNQLNKLAELRKKGLLSEREFIREKEKIMNR